MDNSVLMGETQSAADLQENGDDSLSVGRIRSIDEPVESVSVNEFHHDVGSGFALSHVIDGDNVRVGESSGHSRLLQESGDKLSARRFWKLSYGPDLLDRDGAFDGWISGQIGTTLASSANLFQNDVAPDLSFFHAVRKRLLLVNSAPFYRFRGLV